MSNKLLGIIEASEYTKLDPTAILMLVKNGELKVYKVDGDNKFDKIDLDNVLKDIHILKWYRDIPKSVKKQEDNGT